MHGYDSPVLMPVLSAGRHWSPRSGACFMEYASYLAGERWSDHPACTHPAIGSLARMVNDCTSDAARGELVTLIPSVVGLVSDDETVSVKVAMTAGFAALPIASQERQRALATGLLCCERYLSSIEGTAASSLSESLDEVLLTVPDAARWARDFSAGEGVPKAAAIPRVCDAMLRTSVVGIAEACVDNPDRRLRDLLAAVIADWTSADTMATPATATSMTARELHSAR
jgi:hypothetical protein